MLSKDKTVGLAAKYAEDGFLCSESVLLAISKCLNISSDLIPRIATGFGAGIGRKGEVCGALTGGVMGLGLRFGRSKVEETEGGGRPYWFALELVNQFQSIFGAIRCSKLLGLDLSQPADLQTYRSRNMWDTKCRAYILETTGLVYDFLKAYGKDETLSTA